MMIKSNVALQNYGKFLFEASRVNFCMYCGILTQHQNLVKFQRSKYQNNKK